ncbi:EsaB/YukD family protein [Listeria innocua]|uniref:EsaB/YukD family protein n=1 Tax=Listeria innocua TaxID=1642 RepID=UPI00162817E0|nr:EsaB/YukD family protein [Listeria innocua]MBC1925544.1 hypothetical protein [Listeria innocua]
MIEVTFVLNHQELDMLIPNRVSFVRLTVLLKEALAENGYVLPENYQLKLADKTFHMGEADILGDFAISNGDRIEILVGENK